jgi:hypothetical protein
MPGQTGEHAVQTRYAEELARRRSRFCDSIAVEHDEVAGFELHGVLWARRPLFQHSEGLRARSVQRRDGFGILRDANAGKHTAGHDAETTPLHDPEHYRYEFNLADIAELWRRGSVIPSWLLDLAAASLLEDTDLRAFAGHVSDSGEGRWTIKAAIDEAVPAPVLTAALYQRFSSRGEADFQDKLLSAMRFQFGGHVEKPASGH